MNAPLITTTIEKLHSLDYTVVTCGTDPKLCFHLKFVD